MEYNAFSTWDTNVIMGYKRDNGYNWDQKWGIHRKNKKNDHVSLPYQIYPRYKVNFLGIAYASSIIIERLVTVCVYLPKSAFIHLTYPRTYDDYVLWRVYESARKYCDNLCLCFSKLNDIRQECNPSIQPGRKHRNPEQPSFSHCHNHWHHQSRPCSLRSPSSRSILRAPWNASQPVPGWPAAGCRRHLRGFWKWEITKSPCSNIIHDLEDARGYPHFRKPPSVHKWSLRERLHLHIDPTTGHMPFIVLRVSRWGVDSSALFSSNWFKYLKHFICICLCLCLYVYVYMHMKMYGYMYMPTYKLSVQVYVYVYLNIYYICLFIYVYIYIHCKICYNVSVRIHNSASGQSWHKRCPAPLVRFSKCFDSFHARRLPGLWGQQAENS